MKSLDRASRYHPNRGKGEDRRPVPKRDFRPARPRCSTPYGAVVDSGLTPVATVEAATELQRPESTQGQANTVSQSSAMLTTVHPSRAATSVIGSGSWNVSAVLT